MRRTRGPSTPLIAGMTGILLFAYVGGCRERPASSPHALSRSGRTDPKTNTPTLSTSMVLAPTMEDPLPRPERVMAVSVGNVTHRRRSSPRARPLDDESPPPGLPSAGLRSSPAVVRGSPLALAEEMLQTGNREEAMARMVVMVKTNTQCLPDLVDMVSSQNPDIVLLAAYGLAALGSEDAIRGLLEAYAQLPPDSALRMALAETALTTTNPACVDLLFDTLLSDESQDLKDLSLQLLASLADATVVSQLAQAYDEAKDDATRQLITDTLRHIDNTNDVASLVSLVGSENDPRTDTLSLAAADTLGIMGTLAATTNLFSRLSSATGDRATVLTTAISRINHPESLAWLLSAAKGGVPPASQQVRTAAIQALGNYDESAVRGVLDELKRDASDEIRLAAEKAWLHSHAKPY